MKKNWAGLLRTQQKRRKKKPHHRPPLSSLPRKKNWLLSAWGIPAPFWNGLISFQLGKETFIIQKIHNIIRLLKTAHNYHRHNPSKIEIHRVIIQNKNEIVRRLMRELTLKMRNTFWLRRVLDPHWRRKTTKTPLYREGGTLLLGGRLVRAHSASLQLWAGNQSASLMTLWGEKKPGRHR